MTATAVREVGFPWFDRHATKGGKEIWQWDDDGEPYWGGCTWIGAAAAREYYARKAAMGFPRYDDDRYVEPGFVDYATEYPVGFDSWEEAEAWLMAP